MPIKGQPHKNYGRWPTDHKVKSHTVKVRMTPEDHEAACLRAAARGYTSLADYIRALVDQDSLH